MYGGYLKICEMSQVDSLVLRAKHPDPDPEDPRPWLQNTVKLPFSDLRSLETPVKHDAGRKTLHVWVDL